MENIEHSKALVRRVIEGINDNSIDTELVEPIELSDDPADGMISDLQSVGAALCALRCPRS